MVWLKVANLAESTLAAGISDVATELTVATGEGAKFPASNFEIVVCLDDNTNWEVMLCSSRTNDVLTVVRGGSALAHDAYELVELRVTAEYIEELQEAIDNLLENPPTEDLATNAPTSDWAFDHNARDATAAQQGHATAAQI